MAPGNLTGKIKQPSSRRVFRVVHVFWLPCAHGAIVNVRRMTKQTVAPATRLKSERSSVAYRRTRKNKRANQPVRLSAITTRRHPQNLRSNLVIPARTIPMRMTANFPHHYNVERLPEGDFPPFRKFALRLHQQHARNECASGRKLSRRLTKSL